MWHKSSSTSLFKFYYFEQYSSLRPEKSFKNYFSNFVALLNFYFVDMNPQISNKQGVPFFSRKYSPPIMTPSRLFNFNQKIEKFWAPRYPSFILGSREYQINVAQSQNGYWQTFEQRVCTPAVVRKEYMDRFVGGLAMIMSSIQMEVAGPLVQVLKITRLRLGFLMILEI